MSTSSRERILQALLRSREPISVQGLAELLEISRNAAHQHVVSLDRDGLIERDEIVRTKGRPSQTYRLSEKGRSYFPRQYSLLGRELMEYLLAALGEGELQNGMAQIGTKLAAQLSPAIEGLEGADRIAEIAGLMRDLGYESEMIETVDGAKPQIEAHNCVYHDLAMQNDAVCALDIALLSALSGQKIDHRRCMARGENSCRFAFDDADQD